MMNKKMKLRVKATSEGITVKATAGKHEFIIDEAPQMEGKG